MDRRQFLKGVGATGALSIGGGALVLSSTQSAVAASFTITDPSAVTSDDGSINFVRMQAAQRVEWDGFDTDVHAARYIDRVTIRPNSDNFTAKVNDSTSDDLSTWSGNGDSEGWGGDGEFTSGVGKAGFVRADIDWNIIGDPGASSPSEGGPRSIETPADELDRLEVDTDGETKESTVVFEKEVRLLDSNGNEVAGPNGPYDAAVSSDSFTVSVTNEAATTATNGGGDVSVGATDQSP